MSQATAISRTAAGHDAGRESSVKDTLEQILVAFILAFIFRCFIVEAFVIPTGSMASTLLGAHMDFRCPDCGWKWEVNYSGTNDGDDVNVPSQAAETLPIRCPNCGYKLPRILPGEPHNDATQPPVQFGDRILVQKYIYLLGEPARWDVVVFKSPDTASLPPTVEPYSQNYIKRLIGVPGETVMILDGDIYVSTAAKETAQLTPEDFTVQTKPRKVQEALWRIVYDNDYRPRGMQRKYGLSGTIADPSQPGGTRKIDIVEREEEPWRQPWTPSDARSWDVTGRVFRFDNVGGAATLTFDPGVAPDKHSLTDWLAYDNAHQQAVPHQHRRAQPNPRANPGDLFLDKGYDPNPPNNDPLNPVSDLKLALTYRRTSGDGPLRLVLTKQGHRFAAELTPTGARLLMTRPGANEPVVIGQTSATLTGRPVRVELINADYRVSLHVDGREVLATTPEQFRPDVAALLRDFDQRRPQEMATAAIEAERQQCTVEHVSLWRDLYYLNGALNSIYWGRPNNFPVGDGRGMLMRLGDDEFFVMGDNSMMSSDARVWRREVDLPKEGLYVEGGRVPRRFMLGRAFFVYWPAGYAPIDGWPALVPNFGEMRFIH